MPTNVNWQGLLIVALDPLRRLNDVDRTDNVFAQFVLIDVQSTLADNENAAHCEVNPSARNSGLNLEES